MEYAVNFRFTIAFHIQLFGSHCAVHNESAGTRAICFTAEVALTANQNIALGGFYIHGRIRGNRQGRTVIDGYQKRFCICRIVVVCFRSAIEDRIRGVRRVGDHVRIQFGEDQVVAVRTAQCHFVPFVADHELFADAVSGVIHLEVDRRFGIERRCSIRQFKEDHGVAAHTHQFLARNREVDRRHSFGDLTDRDFTV